MICGILNSIYGTFDHKIYVYSIENAHSLVELGLWPSGDASWDKARRVVAKIEWHAGELFPRIGFIVTNLRWKSSNVVKFYNKRGTAKQWIKEGKYALNWTRLSCHDFTDNQVRLQLFALSYNLGNFLRRLALPKKIRDWSLGTLQVKLIKIGAKVIKHSSLNYKTPCEYEELCLAKIP